MTIFKRTLASLLILGVALPASVLADNFIVNTTADPETGNPANCVGAASQCSLRDALAAANAGPDLDTISFMVDDVIYLRKQLKAFHPVGIEGGGGTTLRIHQDYDVVVQPDRFDDDGNGLYEDVRVLQATYWVEVPVNGAPQLPMLVLHGSGSYVNNMVIDASITPQAADLDVERVDWNSDGRTDNRLYAVQDPDGDFRWLVAGGVLALFDPAAGNGQVTFHKNTLQYFSDTALKIENSAFASVTENSAVAGINEGIRFFNGGVLTVKKNNVSGFRNGLSLQYVSGVTIEDNTLTGNRSGGLTIEDAHAQFGENTVKKNIIESNAAAGLTIWKVDTATVVSNEIRSNEWVGIDLKASGNISVMDNKVVENGSHPIFDGGIRVAEGAGLNSVVGNTVNANSGYGIVLDDALGNLLDKNIVTEQGGAGIVLLHNSQGNVLTNNKAEKNDVGIVSTTIFGGYPSGNTISANGLKDNASFDLRNDDSDPTCNNSWTNNKFKTASDVSGSCIQ